MSGGVGTNNTNRHEIGSYDDLPLKDLTVPVAYEDSRPPTSTPSPSPTLPPVPEILILENGRFFEKTDRDH